MYNYNRDLIYFIKREGTTQNPYNSIVENITVLYEKAFLKEVPVKSFKVVVKIGNTTLTEVQREQDIKTDNHYYVDYKQGIVYFHSSKNNALVTLTYRGQGVLLYPASRIYIDSEYGARDVVKTLRDLINEGASALDAVQQVSTIISRAEIIITQGTILITNTNNALNIINNKMSEISASELDRISSETSRKTNESSRVSAELNRVSAEVLRISSETDRGNAESIRQSKESERLADELIRQSSELDRVRYEASRQSSELDRVRDEASRNVKDLERQTAETDRQTKETERQTKETQRLADEISRQTGESERIAEELDRVSNETDRQSNENSRISSETIRTNAETNRNIKESERITKEIERLADEEERKTSETNRVNAESGRNNRESERVANENIRITNENARIASESSRVSEEILRQSQESQRQTDSSLAITNLNIARVNAENATIEVIRAKDEAVEATTDARNLIDNTVFKEAFNVDVLYERNNIVSYNGSSYIALQDTLGNLPTNQVYWGLMSQRGVDGKGSVASVNGLSPNEQGNVVITAENMGAERVSRKGMADGYAGLDSNAKIPISQIPDTLKQQTYIVLSETERNALTNLISGDKSYETSTGDSYIYDGGQWHILADADWENVSLEWINIINKPNSTVQSIDMSVLNSHTHSNKDILDKFSIVGGKLQHEGKNIGNVDSINGMTGVVTITSESVGTYSKVEIDLAVVDMNNKINSRIPNSEKGIAGGVARLNASGKVVDASGNEVEGKVTSVNGQIGDITGLETTDSVDFKISNHVNNGTKKHIEVLNERPETFDKRGILFTKKGANINTPESTVSADLYRRIYELTEMVEALNNAIIDGGLFPDRGDIDAGLFTSLDDGKPIDGGTFTSPDEVEGVDGGGF